MLKHATCEIARISIAVERRIAGFCTNMALIIFSKDREIEYLSAMSTIWNV
jgi:hypothetical protein